MINTIPNRSYKDGYQDRPTPRPNSDVVREKRHSPRSPEEVDLALTAIWALYKFIDGVGTKREALEEHLNCMHLLYERYLEETLEEPNFFGPSISSLLAGEASGGPSHDRP